MTTERFIVLGLAQVRSAWFSELSRWSSSGTLPVDFIKCVSADEITSRLRSGRVVSAVLVDAQRTGVDRDLIDLARQYGIASIVVDGDHRDWVALGASAQLPTSFSRADLLAALSSHTAPVGRLGVGIESEPSDAPSHWRGRLVAVTSPGGAGASTMAMALAQGMAADARYAAMVLLADLALDADHAMLHDARDVVPGVQELVEAFRVGTMEPDATRQLTYQVADRGYQLLLGLRHHRDWTAIRPRAFEAALDALRRSFRVVIADVDADVEGHDRTGSLDIEERNCFARMCTQRADVVMVVGAGGAKGMHSLVRTVHRLVDHGVDADAILPVINRVSRSPRVRAGLTRDFAQLTNNFATVTDPVFVGERRGLDDLISVAAPLPSTIARSMATAVGAAFTKTPQDPVDGRVVVGSGHPIPVAPGSLGSWAADQGGAGKQ